MKRSRSRNRSLEVRYRRRGGAIVGFAVSGHASFAACGRDIVCAAVSALILSAANGLREHCAAAPKVSDRPSGYRLDLPRGGGMRAQAVLETMVSGLEAIAASYPGHLTVSQATLGRTGPAARRTKAKALRDKRSPGGL